MELTKKAYHTPDVLGFVFRAAPVCTVLHLLLSVVHAIMPTAAMALATANFVDTATVVLQGGRPHRDIYLPLALLLLTIGIQTTIGSVVQLIRSRIETNLQVILKPAVVGIQAKLEYKHIENAESWELISRVSRDPVASVMAGYDGMAEMLRSIVCVVSVLILILVQIWWAVFIVLAFSVPMFWLSMWAGKKNYQAERDTEKYARRADYLDEVLSGRDGVDERTLFGFGDAVGLRWREQYEAARVRRVRVRARNFVINRGGSVILLLIAPLIALTLLGPVTRGEISPGMFMGVLNAVFSMVNLLGWQVPDSLERVSNLREYMKDLTAFKDLSKTIRASDLPDAEPIVFETLEFRGVRFKYPSGTEYILDGISFTLERGRHYAFVGKNGAGKTTITKLLTGLYTEYEGEILVNGKELREYQAGAVKALFSVVYQDFARYYIPLRDNIALGDVSGAATKDRVLAASEQAGLGDAVARLGHGVDTPLGKILTDGQDISGGEWQRVAIARSLISRAPVKMLDEPTAALDPVSESKIYSEFEKLMRGKTTVFISHRLGSTKLADEILVIGGGRVLERGTHEALMAASGQYAEMFEAQRGWYQ